MKKADQLARLCHLDIAVTIRKNGRYYTYRSIDHELWPPARSEIVSGTLTNRSWTDNAKETSYPLPVNLVPEDFDLLVGGKQEKKEARIDD